MESIINKVKKGKLSKEDLKNLTTSKRPREDVKKLYDEFNKKDRKIRETQIGNTQIDKIIGDGESKKLVKAIRTPINFQKKIVKTSVAFEFGNPVSLLPKKENDLTDKIIDVWADCRLDSKLQKIKIAQKSETQSALVFHYKKKDDELELKCRILGFKDGEFTPVFDSMGDMVCFIWEYKTRVDGKDIENVWIYDDKTVSKFKSEKEGFKLVTNNLHGFGKIPVVYFSQEESDYEDVKELIDRYETSISKLGASNNYSGSPLLFTVGEITGMPDRDADGKMLNTELVKDDEGRTSQGDAKFLTHDNAPKSVELEQKTLKGLIYSLSDTPDLSFESLKGIGNVSGITLKLMFLGSILKAKLNEGDNRTDIERILNIIKSGLITKDNKLKAESKETSFDIKFGNILPDDLADTITYLVNAVEGKILSRKKAIEILAMSDNAQDEIDQIKKELEEQSKVTKPVE